MNGSQPPPTSPTPPSLRLLLDTPRIPWGPQGTIPLDIPHDWPRPSVVSPDLSEPLADYPAALRQAIEVPGGWPALTAGDRVAIVVDDPSRWTPVRTVLPLVLERLHASGVRPEEIAICVGVGRHAAVDADAMRQRVGDEIVERYACHSPPVDDLDAYDELGTTPEGIPVRVFRPVAEARLRILVGSVLPHLQAGFGGGWKLIFPGCSHRSTLGALHRQGLDGDTAALLGMDAHSNPMRQAIQHAAQWLPGETLSISHVLGGPGQVFQVAFGTPDAVQDRLAAEARRRFQAPPAPPCDLLIASNHPWPGDPMQSFKALLHHRAACRTGGVLVGFFWTDPAEIDRSFPLGALKSIAATGPGGGWLLRRGLAAADHLLAALNASSSFMVRWARELVVDRHVLIYAPPLHDRLGPHLGPVRIFSQTSTLWKAIVDSLNGPPAAIRLFTHGGMTYVSQS